MIVTEFATTATDVVTCEACWRNPVQAARTTSHSTRRDLLCVPCAQQDHPVRVEIFPPLGIYKLSKHRNRRPPRSEKRVAI
ncbi:hypothetical protein EF910_21185 [Streptomyces sp. WAC07149]|uniref:hypothetical protein n=1 Tax=Streptomyces sp. WAC07149 TaxID=2487425 RepID=UPI000F7B3537|nr:hypothetical protein [Streptomyces sp. WAC07149]RST03104.1 hypothetical protein EF910_21185 [Streptomyces sp. WAC07149]